MNLNNSLEAPTNTKQIKNIKYREKKRTTQPTNNTAHKHCRRNISSHSYDKQSSVRAADDPQKRPYSSSNMPNRRPDDRLHIFLPRHGGTVGVDRTFNLGHFFATTLVYKHPRVIKNDTKDHPIFIGPLLLHRCLIQNLLFLLRIHCHRFQVRWYEATTATKHVLRLWRREGPKPNPLKTLFHLQPDDYVQSILKTTLTTTCRIKWRYTRRNDIV